MSSGGGDTTTVQQADPWIGVQGPLRDYYAAIGDLMYGVPGQTVTGGTQTLTGYELPGGEWGGMVPELDITPAVEDTIDRVAGGRLYDLPYTEGLINAAEGEGGQRTPTIDKKNWLRQPMVAGIPQELSQAQQLISERALGGSPLTGLSQQALESGLEGYNPALGMYSPIAQGSEMYTNPAYSLLGQTAMGGAINPYLNQMYGTAAQQVGSSFQDIVMPSIASRYGMARRTGSGAEQQAYEGAFGQLGQSLSGLASDIYGRGYESERGRQMQAAGTLSNVYGAEQAQRMGAIGGLGDTYAQQLKDKLQYSMYAPQLAQVDYQDLAQLANVGLQKQAYQQQLIDAPLQRLQTIGGMLQPGLGFGTQTSTMPTYSNPYAGAIGGGMAGYTLAGSNYGPWGALIGAGLGYMASQ